MKQEHQVGSLNSCTNELQQHAYAQKIGITGRPSRIYGISTRTSPTSRKIVYEGISASRYSDTKYTRDGRNEESSRTTSRRILSSVAHNVISTSTNTARTELHSMITIHHANTGGSRAARLKIPQTIVIHVSCLVPCRT